MRVGIVGFGKMGMLHGALLNTLENANLIAITDTSKFVLNGFKSLFPHIQVFTSYEKMIDKCDLDVVVIATPSFNHVPIALYAIERNIHLFLEKPLSNSLKDCKELIEAQANSNSISMMGFCMRYNPMFAKGKELIDTGFIGKVTDVKAYMYCSDVLHEQSGWRFDPDVSGGGVLIDFAVHMVDLLYYYFGNVDSVSGTCRSIHSKKVEDEVEAELYFERGIKANLYASWSKEEYRKPFYKMELQGEKGLISITDQEITIDLHNQQTEKIYYPEIYEGEYIDIGGPHFSKQMRLFVEGVTENKEPLANLKAGLAVQKIIDAIYIASSNNKPQAVSEDVMHNEN